MEAKTQGYLNGRRKNNIMALLVVNQKTCSQCGICAAVCPGSFIGFRKNSFPVPTPVMDLGCIRCGHCVAVCPSGSLSHVEVPAEQSVGWEKSSDIAFAQAARLIKGRRSIREYKEKRVPFEEIERVIEVARYAPTGHNSQGVRWLVITSPDTIKHLTEIGLEWMRWAVRNIPAMNTVIKGLLRLQESGQDVFLREAPAVVFTFGPKNSLLSPIDCVNAAAYFDLAASSAGLGCCWNGLLLLSAASYPNMIKAVNLPEGSEPYACLMLGYPRYKYPRAPMRKPAQIIYRA
jgi:nitroreductase/ferredoxin